MAVHSVDTTKFTLTHQDENWLCWAACVKAVAEYYGVSAPDHKGIAALAGKVNAPGNPVPVLKTHFKIDSDRIIDHRMLASPGVLKANATDVRAALKGLKDGPMIAVLSTHNNGKWQMTDPTTGAVSDYLFRHGVVFWKYDDAADEATLRDPARKPPVSSDFTVKVDKLVERFEYMKIADLGPKAKAALVSPPATIDVRLVELWKHHL